MGKNVSPMVRVSVRLVGEPAEKVLAIAAREGNATVNVLRRLISIGLRHEEETNGTHT